MDVFGFDMNHDAVKLKLLVEFLTQMLQQICIRIYEHVDSTCIVYVIAMGMLFSQFKITFLGIV